MKKNDEKVITASKKIFKRGGNLWLTVSDKFGNEEVIKITIFPNFSGDKGGSGGGGGKSTTTVKPIVKKETNWITNKNNIPDSPRPNL